MDRKHKHNPLYGGRTTVVVFLGSSGVLSIAFFSAGTCSSNFSNLMPVRLSMTGGNWL